MVVISISNNSGYLLLVPTATVILKLFCPISSIKYVCNSSLFILLVAIKLLFVSCPECERHDIIAYIILSYSGCKSVRIIMLISYKLLFVVLCIIST